TASYNATTGVLTLSGFVTVANYQTALQAVTYANSSQNPSTLTRTVSFKANDGTADSNTGTRNISITPVNNPPVVTTTTTPLNYVPRSGAVLMDNAITVTDVDSANLASATVSITAGFVNGEDVLALPNPPTGITASYSAGVLTLTGPAAVSGYQTALRSVTYANTGQNPSTATRTVSFKANDGQADSTVATRNINENPVVIRVSDTSVLEGAAGQNTPVHLQVVRVGAIDKPIQISYTTEDGTATTAHNDYQAKSGTVTFSGNNTGGVLRDFLAFSPTFQGGVRVAVGDVNGDGIADIIVGAGPGDRPTVSVYDGATGNQLTTFLAFDAGFRGGVYVAAGDVNGDGKADIIVGAGAGGGPAVTVYSGADYSVLSQFFAFDPQFTGGVRVAAGDVDGDGKADIIVGAGPGAGPHVKVFKGTDLALLDSFFAFSPAFSGGVFVAAGDVNGDGKADIIVGADAGGAPQVSVFSGQSGQVILQFFAYDPTFSGGVRVAAADLNGDGKAEIITAPGAGMSPSVVRVFDGMTGNTLNELTPFPTLSGGIFVSGGALLGPGGDDLVFGADTITPEVKAVITGGAGEVQTVDLTVIGNNVIEPDKQFKVRLSNIQASGQNVIFAGGQDTEAATITILNDDGENPPVVTTTATTVNYTERSVPVTLDPGITVSDADNTTLAGATVTISSNFQSSQDILALASPPTGIQANYSAGVLTLSGTASVTAYQTALSSVTYSNSSHNPSPLTRTVSFKANDGQKDSNLATKTISITPINDPPVVTTTGTALSYTVASTAVRVDPGIFVTDVDSTTLAGAVVSIINNFQSNEDSLALPNPPAGIKPVYNAGVLTLTGSASVAAYQAALSSVRYVNSSLHPSMLTRTVSFQANDGQADSNTAQRDIAFVKANQFISFSPPFVVTFDQSPITLNATASSGLPVTFSIVNGPATIDPNHNNQVILQGIGTVVVQALQAGDDDYIAESQQQTFTVFPGNQTITFDPVSNKLTSDPAFALNATASSGLDVTYSVVTGRVTLDGANVTLTGPGLVTVTASQSGEPNYNPATSVTQSFFVSRFTKLVDFSGTTGPAPGANPFGNVVPEVDGNFYVTTFSGGAHNLGTVLRITPAGVVLQRADFSGAANGAYPAASVEPDTQGNYWGLTVFGGANDQGVVFKLNPDGVLTKVHDFNTADGAYPWGGLTRGGDGNFYGMTSADGDNGWGTAFKITPDGVFTKLLDFDGKNNGAAPLGNLALVSPGSVSPGFVGATSQGGANNDGVLFYLDATGTFLKLLDFDGAGHGAAPGGDILFDPSSASIYVLTTKGGVNDLGAIVAYPISSQSTNKLADFDGAGLGARPYGVLALANDHAFYGLAHEGGANNLGTIFRMTNSGSTASLTTLASFPVGDPGNGANPFDSLVQAADGAFYGTTSSGGANNLGTIFNGSSFISS
ncbi:MAG: beta strand repeat-containing protein, partial [Limisphaerales bacterium]